MKQLLALILGVTLVAFAADALAGQMAYLAQDNEELYGTWVLTLPTRKLIHKPDGTFEVSWPDISGYGAGRRYGRYLITGKWTDSEGNIWYKWHWVSSDSREFYTLGKISNSGSTLEVISASDKYPTEIDPKRAGYHKYTRE